MKITLELKYGEIHVNKTVYVLQSSTLQ